MSKIEGHRTELSVSSAQISVVVAAILSTQSDSNHNSQGTCYSIESMAHSATLKKFVLLATMKNMNWPCQPLVTSHQEKC